MAGTSIVEICSNALLLVGAGTISDLNENNDRARLCANLWNQTRRATLRAHPWKFAKARVKLGPASPVPVFGWEQKFLLPGDWLRTLQVGEEATDRPDYLEEGRYIYMNEPELALVYVQEVEDPLRFDSLFVDAVSARMAFNVAWPLTKDKDLLAAMGQIYGAKLQEARFVDGVSNPPGQLDDSPILIARRSR
jgi:hypothetical protein